MKATPSRQVIRIKEVINQGILSRCFLKFSKVILKKCISLREDEIFEHCEIKIKGACILIIQ